MGSVLGTHALVPHPDTPARSIRSVTVEMRMTGPRKVLLAFYAAPGAALAVSSAVLPGRADELWRHTCFELFVRPVDGPAYFEFNLSPSGQWAAYAFDDYRAGMRDLDLPVDPHIELERQGETFVLEADVDLAAIAQGKLLAGLSAVIEEVDGTKSYWALNHPPGAPDFHHPDCFALELPGAG